MHYDHAGTLADFPNARFHIQDEEMGFVTGRFMCHHALRHAYECEDVVTMVKKIYKDEVCFHDGDAQLAPGVSVHLIGGHAKGLMSVRVETKRGPVVLASDAAHLYANMEQQKPFPIVFNVGDMMEGWKKLYSLAGGERRLVVPGHDPLVTRRYPALTKDLQGIVMRLDADPTE
jgi:glyoxylase-like metal-dependent hydrolase (beta-lactamase superfamily II)